MGKGGPIQSVVSPVQPSVPQPMGGSGNPYASRYVSPNPISETPQPAFYSAPSQPEQPSFQPRGYMSPFQGMGGKGMGGGYRSMGGGYRSMGGKGGFGGGFSPFGGYYETPSNPYSRPFEQNFAPRYQTNPYAQQPPMMPRDPRTLPIETPQPAFQPDSRVSRFVTLPYRPEVIQPAPQPQPSLEPGMKPGGSPLIGDRMPTRDPIGGKGAALQPRFFKNGGEVK